MRADRIVRNLVHSRFLVTLTDSTVFAGLLADADKTTLHLLDAEAVQPDGSKVKADSDLYLPRSRVAYMQVLN